VSVSFQLHDHRLSIVIPNARSFPHALIKQLSEQVVEGDEILVVQNRPRRVARDWIGIAPEVQSQSSSRKNSITTVLPINVTTPSIAHQIISKTLQSNDGAAAARNKGWQHAINSSILFLDDDIIVDEGFLNNIRGYLSRKPIAGLVTFRICNMPESPWSSLVNMTISLDRGTDIRNSGGAALRIQDVWMFGAGAAMLADRSLLKQTDGFKHQLGSGLRNGGAEDTEFIWHSSRHAVVEYYGQISVLHGVAYEFQDITRKLREYGRAIGHLGGMTGAMDGFRYLRGYCLHLKAATRASEIQSLPAQKFIQLRASVAIAIMESIRVFAQSLMHRRRPDVLCNQCQEGSL